MAADDTPRRQGPVPLTDLFDGALKQLVSPPDAGAPGDGFLYSGNRHESVPRALFMDTRLTPLERNAWQVIRLRLNDDGVTAFPTYEQLRPWLAAMPCGGQASHETVARALTLLRLTRWLSLVRRRRDPKTGRIQGNLYVLHDEALTPFEAMQLDPDYLTLVSQSLDHAGKAVRIVGLNTLREIAEDPLLAGRVLPSRLQVQARRMAQQDGAPAETCPPPEGIHESEAGAEALLRRLDPPSSESEAGAKPASDGDLRNPKKDRTVRIKDIKEVRTVPRAHATQDAMQGLRLPERFTGLQKEQQAGALVALRQVEAPLRQAVLDEWDARCRTSTVRNPAGYLFGIVQKAIRGEFKAWAGNAREPPPAAARDAPTPKPDAAPSEVAREHIQRLRELLRKR